MMTALPGDEDETVLEPSHARSQELDSGPLPGADGPRPAVPAPSGRWGTWRRKVFTARRRTDAWLMLAFGTVTALATHLRSGYSYSSGDQSVLQAYGITWADPGAFVNDWFTHSAPQPHWSFDLVTYLGEMLHARPYVYFAYWLLAMFVFGLGTAWLTRHWLPKHAWWVGGLVPVVVVMGPQSAVGSTTPLLATAIPHVLGGCLAYLTIAALITRRFYVACVVAALTSIAHVQHGANIAVILAAVAIVAARLSTRQRITMLGTAAAVAVASVVATTARGIVGSGDDFIEICTQVIPVHCDANAWSVGILAEACAAVGGIGLLVAARWRRDGRVLVASVGLAALGLALGLFADRVDLPFFGELAQRVNIYRLVAIVIPFVAWAALTATFGVRRRWRPAVAALSALLLVYWLMEPYYSGLSAVVFPQRHWPYLFVGVLVVLSVVPTVFLRPRLPVWLVWLPALLVLLLLDFRVPFHRAWPDLDASSSLGYQMGQAVEDSTPVGAVIVADPRNDSIHAFARRAVIADVKNVPYGGRPWAEYKDRISDLTGGAPLLGFQTRPAFLDLSIEDVIRLKEKYDADYLFLAPDDPKVQQAVDAGWPVVAGSDPERFWLFKIP